MARVGKRKTTLADVLLADFAGELVKSAENVGMDLLKALHRAGLQG